MPGNWPVPFGKGPSEKDPRHGNLVGGLLHLTGGGWKRDVGHGRSESCPGETLDRGAETYRRSAPPRQPPTLLRYGNSARVFDAISQYALERLAGFVEAPQTQPYLGYAPGDLRVTGQLWPDHLVRKSDLSRACL